MQREAIGLIQTGELPNPILLKDYADKMCEKKVLSTENHKSDIVIHFSGSQIFHL